MNKEGGLQYPLFRVHTFGGFALERLLALPPEKGYEPTYEQIAEKAWRSRSSARSLFKILLCRIKRRAPRDVLLEALWPEAQAASADNSLDAAATVLRSVLRLGRGGSLLRTIHVGNVTFYELPGQQWIWSDIDDFTHLLIQAEHAESQNHDPLPLLETALRLADGEFLEEEAYSEWAQMRRRTVAAAQQRLLCWLVNLYLQRDLPRRAEALLFSFLEANPTNEDALFGLMTLLARQGRYQEAIRCYQHMADMLHEEERQEPSPRMKDLATLCGYTHDTVETIYPDLMVPPVLHVSHRQLYVDTHSSLAGVGEMEQHTSYGIFEAYLLNMIQQYEGQGIWYTDLQEMVAQEIRRRDEMTPHPDDAHVLSRRQALVAIAALPASLPVLAQAKATTVAADVFLPQCAASITACRHLLNGNDLATVEHILPGYLPFLESLVRQPSRQQKAAAGMAAQVYQLKSILALHRLNFRARELTARRAVDYSRLAEDPHQHVAALRQLASALQTGQQAEKVLEVCQEALPLLTRVTPLLQSSIIIKLAWASAYMGQEQDALRYLGLSEEALSEHPENDPSLLFSDFRPASLFLWKGFTYIALSQHASQSAYHQHAWDSFAHVAELSSTTPVPERIRIEVINNQAGVALALGDLDLSCAYIETGVKGARLLGSQKRYTEAFMTYRQARQMWPQETRVKELADLFVR